jgi:serine/threonine-protein kinase
VLFHLVCGRLPFVASTPADMIAAHLRETPPLPSMFVPQIPITIDTIAMRCLAKQAGDRYASMTELARELGAAIGSLSEIPTIAPVRASSRDGSRATPAPVLGSPAPRRADPPVVARGGDTVASLGGHAPVYPHGSQPSTLASGVGESMPPTPRGGRLVAAVVAMLAVGAIVVTIVIAASRPTESRPEPGSAVGSAVSSAVGSAVDRTVPAGSPDEAGVATPALIDAGRASVAPPDAPPGDAAPVDGARPAIPPLDAPRQRPRPHGSDYDPYANP